MSFFGLHIATSGLFVAQRALQVISHNISNENTPGYSRQRLDMKQTMPLELPGVKGTLGTGVEAEAVIQIREMFYDLKIREETSYQGHWDFLNEGLSNIESILNEPSESGIKTVVNEFFAALDVLSGNAENLTTRALVRQKAIAFTESVKTMYKKMNELQEQVNFQIKSDVEMINSYAIQIRDLNKSIYETEIGAGKANDLRDQRNLLVDKLSKYVKVQTYEDYHGEFTVAIHGKPLVSHLKADKILLTKRDEVLNYDDVPGMYELSWQSGSKFKTTAGELRALLDFRDNISGDTKGLPYYKDRLNLYVDRVASELNRIHTQGYDLDKNKGVMFFTKKNMSSRKYDKFLLEQGLDGGKPIDVTEEVLKDIDIEATDFKNSKVIANNIKNILMNNPDYGHKSIKLLSDGKYYIVDRVTAGEITLSDDLEKDLNKFAAAANIQGLPKQGDNILKMVNLTNNEQLFAWGSAEGFINSLVANLGVDKGETERMSKNEKSMVVEIENKRQSIMGVSLDEEATMMIKFQHSYNANARMLTTMDELLDRVINRLGRVGL